MKKESLIYVAGHESFLGAALVRKLRGLGYDNLLLCKEKEENFLRQGQIKEFFDKNAPEYVFLSKEKSGGILVNSSYPAEFIYENLSVQTNAIDAAYKSKVKKLLFFGSSCTYPKMCPQPMKEEYLLTGSPESTSEAYAIAKIAGIKMCQAYNKQYGTKFISIIPANLFGPGDDFDLETSHVLPALIRKFHAAKISNLKQVAIWGSGSPKREFLYVDDFADACIFLMNTYKGSEVINAGSGRGISVKELALMIKDIVGFEGEIVFDKSKPDGMPIKILDSEKIKNLGWKPKYTFDCALRETYEWFRLNESREGCIG